MALDRPQHDADAAAFLRTGNDAILLMPENRYDEIAATLPAGWGVLGRARPIFRKHDVLAIGALTEGTPATARTAAAPEVTR